MSILTFALLTAASALSPASWHATDDFGPLQINETTIPDEVYVMGDVHGDSSIMNLILQAADVVDNDGSWHSVPGMTRYFLQLGDVVDRGPASKRAYQQIERMRSGAREVGDEVVSVYGNHELLCLCGQTHYFSPDELNNFYHGNMAEVNMDFSAEGETGAAIRKEYIPAFQLSDTYFVHAGIDDGFRSHSVTEMRNELLEELDGHKCARSMSDGNILGNTGPFWTRKISNNFKPGEGQLADACGYLDGALEAKGVSKVIVGHTPTASGNVESHCSGRWVMHDTGLSRWMMSAPRISTLYKTEDASGEVLPLSEWLHVMWKPALNFSDPLVGQFLNAKDLTASEQSQFIEDKRQLMRSGYEEKRLAEAKNYQLGVNDEL